MKDQTKTVTASSELPGAEENLNKVTSEKIRVKIPSSQQHVEKETSANTLGHPQKATSAKETIVRGDEQQYGDGTEDSFTSSLLQHAEVFDGEQEGQHKSGRSHLIKDGDVTNHNKQLMSETSHSVETTGEASDQEKLVESAHLLQQVTQDGHKTPSNEQSVKGPHMTPGSHQLFEGLPDVDPHNKHSVDGSDVTPSNERSIDFPGTTSSSDPSVELLPNMTPGIEQPVESPSTIPGSKKAGGSSDVPPESDHLVKVPDRTFVTQQSDDVVPGADDEQLSDDSSSKTRTSEPLTESPDSGSEQSVMAPEKTPVSKWLLESPDSSSQQSLFDSGMTSSSEKSVDSPGTCSEPSVKSAASNPNSEQSQPNSQTVPKSEQPVESHQSEEDDGSIVDNSGKLEDPDGETEMEKSTEEPGDGEWGCILDLTRVRRRSSVPHTSSSSN